ncbi:RNA-binding domain-containing protein [Paramicrosporidium saccamoebae]|uniref:RNA-binding domain-containing protein n=1 Tax=Paramicrosporidium saccamoebae TaxID=1246581 RepID=A0A2H9THB1_9FUNG|nr:RNA-binding domain-containing protein [Paramicrosporidium saccamoebae]
MSASRSRLPPEVNRILFVRNLPYKISSEDMYDLFGKGTNKETRGTAYVVYDDIYDAKNACEHLSGFNLLGRYLIVLYWQPNKITKRNTERQRAELETLRAQNNL